MSNSHKLALGFFVQRSVMVGTRKKVRFMQTKCPPINMKSAYTKARYSLDLIRRYRVIGAEMLKN